MNSSTAETLSQIPEKLEFLYSPKRYKVLYGGRGGAKSWGVARALLDIGVDRQIKVLCAREFQNSIRDSVHRLLSDQVVQLGLESFYDVQTQAIYGKNGTAFAFEGIKHNITRIKSYEGVDIVWVEEAQKVSKNSWDVLIPTIRREGSEIWMTFNPEFEDDETYSRFVLNPPDSAEVVEIGYQDNPWFPLVLEQERLALKKRDPDQYDHVWGGKCRQWLEGAIYANELRAVFDEERITAVPHDSKSPVFTAWDLGHTDDTAIWWYQVIGGEIHILESYAASGEDLSTYATQITGKAIIIDHVEGRVRVTIGADMDGLEHRRAYNYETHWLPHDAKARTLASGGKSIQAQLAAVFGWGEIRIVPNLTVEDGIQAARTTFPRCWFDKDGTVDGLKALRKYRRELQQDEVSLRKTPKHDWTSHYSDGFRYLAIAWDQPRAAPQEDNPELDAWGRVKAEGSWRTV